MLLALWPQGWSRQQRSNATLVAALVVMVLALSLLGQLLSFFPDPIGPNAQAFSEGARTTLWLTLVSGAVGLVLGTAAALARTARWTPVRWVAGVYIWAIRGTPLLVQILFVYFALPVLVPGLNLPDFAAAVVALGLNVVVGFAGLLDLLHPGVQIRRKLANLLHYLAGALLDIGDHHPDFIGGRGGAPGQPTHFIRHHGEPAPVFTGPRRFNRRVERQ